VSKRQIKDDIDNFIDNEIHVPTRTIYIGGEVDHVLAERAVKNLHILDNTPAQDTAIKIILNTEGGLWEHGMAIYDAIRKCKSHVTITVSGQAYSMGSIILQAADERLLDQHSAFMIHYGTLHVGGHSKIVYRWAENTKKCDKVMENIYLAKLREVEPKFKLQKLQGMLNFDTILTPRETVLLGLADGIVMADRTVLRRKDLIDFGDL
jgi:ATP-dependent Clp protease protease subunit